MRHSDDLFQLIKSLTQTEKRYFKLFAFSSNKKGGNNYSKLFDAIDRWEDQREYDEELLKIKFKKLPFSKQLHVTKNYLYSLILKSLRNYYNISCENKLQEYLKDSEILFRRKLYKQCDKVLQKAEEYALQNERYTYLYEAYRFQERILSFLHLAPRVEIEKLKELETKRGNALRLFTNQNNYRDIWFRLYRWHKQYGSEIRTKEAMWHVNKIIGDPLLQNSSLALCFDSLRFYFMSWSLYYFVKEDIEKAFEANKQLIAVYEESTIRIRNNIRAYIATLHNHAHRCISLNKQEELKLTNDKLKKLPEKFSDLITEELKSELQLFCFTNELIYYISMQEFSKSMEVIQSHQHILQEPSMFNDWRWVVDSFYYTAYVYFLNKQYKTALQWLNKIFMNSNEDKVPHTQTNARILKVILYYELQHFDLIEYAIKSCYRFLLKKNKLNASEKIILLAIKNLSEINSSNDIYSILEDLLEKLNLCDENFYKTYYSNLNLEDWIKGKLKELKASKV